MYNLKKLTPYTNFFYKTFFITYLRDKSVYYKATMPFNEIQRGFKCKGKQSTYVTSFNTFFIKNGYFLKNLSNFLRTFLVIYKYFLNLNSKGGFTNTLNNKTYLYLIEFFFNINYRKSMLNINKLMG